MEQEQRLKKAQNFIWNNARILERFLFSALFTERVKQPVLTALRAYQNEDGGFGNALEPDKRCPSSQPVDVEIAFHVLDAIEAMDDPMVQRACDFLMSITTAEGGVPVALPTINEYPHAPWWTVDSQPAANLNPTAAIVGLLYKHHIQHPWITPATRFCWQQIESTTTTEYHTLMPAITFLEYVPDRERAHKALQNIGERLMQPGVVELDPEATGYIQKPLDWAPTPHSYCRQLFSDKIIAIHLQALAQRQQSDGGWPITWDAISTSVECEARGRVTIDALRTLNAYQHHD